MFTRRHLLQFLLIAPLATPALAERSRVVTQNGMALHGYDPVSYFNASGPLDGQNAHRLMWHNAIWRFASARNQMIFEHDPHAFAPQYGGHCAMAMTSGALSDITPEAWALYDGKLYLMHSTLARDRWVRQPDQFVAEADAHWPSALTL
ncbi:MAG: YHS domain-containing (seleno)protein [Pseudomonadota bacterium]